MSIDSRDARDRKCGQLLVSEKASQCNLVTARRGGGSLLLNQGRSVDSDVGMLRPLGPETESNKKTVLAVL